MIRALVLMLIATTTLSACGNWGGKGNPWGNRVAYDGAYFRVKASGDKENRQNFTVDVRDAGKTLVGARQAASAKAAEYCIRQYGRSDMTWEVSPEVEDAMLPIVEGDLILRGTCDGWR